MEGSSSDRGTAADDRVQFETLITDLSARLGLKPTTIEARMRRLGISRPGLVLLLASLQSLAGPPIAPLL